MIKKVVNSLLGMVNLKLIISDSFENGKKQNSYISAKDTVESARKTNMSICDYVEKQWDQVGETQKVIDSMAKFGAFSTHNPTVCEIGAGTGRYMEKIIEKCNPIRYESYETAKDWAEWLQKEYPIITQTTSGSSLEATDDESIDLIHSHGVFVYLKFLDNIRYFDEMIRVIKPNGYTVFDCYTEECMTPEILNRWLSSKHNFPTLLPNDYVINHFTNNNLELAGTFLNSHGQGNSKYFVFKKK